MNLLLLIKDILNPIHKIFYSAILHAKYRQKYPTCIFYDGSFFDLNSKLGKYNVLFKNASLYNSTIDDYTFIQKESTICNTDIGKFCSIAQRVSIGLGQHPTSYVSSHPSFYSSSQPLAKTFCSSDIYNPFKRTFIGNDVWIGQNAIVLDGVTIGSGSIIGAGAVVTKDIPEYAIVVGIPAKIKRYRFDLEICSKLLEIKWWNLSEGQLSEFCNYFSNPELFLNAISQSTKILQE